MSAEIPNQRHLPRSALAKVPRQQRSIAMVHAIVDAAKRVIEREGLEAFTTNRVATVAGVSVGSLYQYFPNKDALLLGVVERGMLFAEEVIRHEVAAGEAASFDQAFAEVMRALVLHLEPRRPLLREILGGTPLLSETGFVAVVEGCVRDMLAGLRARCGLPPLEPAASYVVVNALAFLFLKWMTEQPAHLPLDTFVAQTGRLVAAMSE